MDRENQARQTHDGQSNSEPDLGSLLVVLLKGVLYQDVDSRRWSDLLRLQNRVRDYVSVLSLELILDEAEGYAFLKMRQVDGDDGQTNRKSDEVPRLISRRQLSFPVSLLLALLRKKLAEFDAGGGETRLILTRDNIVDLIRLFLPDSSNEAKIVSQIERHINKVVDLGFLRRLKSGIATGQPSYEIRRIIKAYIDAQWLAELDANLEIYRQQLQGRDSNGE